MAVSSPPTIWCCGKRFYQISPDIGVFPGHRRGRYTSHGVDGLLQGVLASLPAAATLLITSDHGNLEDPGTKGHTYHPVPLIVWDPAPPYFHEVTDLTGVTPAILAYLEGQSP